MNDMWPTAEVRWFFRGPLPAGILDWFAPGRDLSPDARVDSYLLFPGCETIGVKQREGKFEIKALRGSSETVIFANRVTGRMESWVKWSYAGPGIDPFITGLQQSPAGWLSVEKQRWLRKFSLDQHAPAEVAATELPAEGCNVEIAAVRARQTDCWTIGIEGYSLSNRIRQNLDIVAAHFFAHHPPPQPLDTTRSCSYPVWLNGLI